MENVTYKVGLAARVGVDASGLRIAFAVGRLRAIALACPSVLCQGVNTYIRRENGFSKRFSLHTGA